MQQIVYSEVDAHFTNISWWKTKVMVTLMHDVIQSMITKSLGLMSSDLVCMFFMAAKILISFQFDFLGSKVEVMMTF